MSFKDYLVRLVSLVCERSGCYRADMWAKLACRFGVHDWSGWKPLDPDDPSKQIRTCARCSRVKFNNGPAVFRWDYPIQ
jgi:hypothetical protein